jgi:2',3'-cyclic-nucleotide 2'-phosphodiesterase (5'-nucleotidase family)
VDGGSFLTKTNFMPEMVDDTNVGGMVAMGYVASTISAEDLKKGVNYVKERAESNGLALVSANVYDEETGEHAVAPYIIVKRAGVKLGITGVLRSNSETIKGNPNNGSPSLKVADPAESLRGLLPRLREEADFVVLLSSMGLDPAKDLVGEVEGIDFLVVGNHRSYSGEAYEVGTTVFLQPGQRGQQMSDYRLKFDENGNYSGYTGKSIVLGEKMPSDASIALLLKEHKLDIEAARKKQTAERLDAAAKEQKEQRAQEYEETCLGVDASCKRCHSQEYDQWLTTAHGKAFQTLERDHQSLNPACLKCHTTCYLDLPDDGSVAVQGFLRGVQCEACHGVGAEHARDGSYGAVSVATCLPCHDERNSPDFDFATYLSQVTH